MDNYGIEIIERIQFVLKAKNVSLNSFAASCNIGRSTFSSQIQKKTVSINFVYAILYTYRDVSPDWLLFGKGEMMRNTNSVNYDNIISSLQEQLSKKEIELELANKQIALLIEKLATANTSVIGGVVNNNGKTTIINNKE